MKKRKLAVREIPIGDLKPYPKNARTHSAEQIEQLTASLREFGWTNPILIDEHNTIVAGHARLEAAVKLGMDAVPCIALADLTEAQRKAYIIADNKLALNAGWDEPLLGAELMALDGMGFDCELTGFSGTELEGLFARAQSAGEGLTDEDAVPEAQDEIVSRMGDVWLCGRHRVRCGDSTKAEDVAGLLAGVEPHLICTSPPYAQQRDYQSDGVKDWDALMQGCFCHFAAKHTQILVNLGLVHRDCEWWPYWEEWIDWMRAQGWRRFGWYIWDQGFGLPGDWNGRLAPSFEFVFHFNKEIKRANKTHQKKSENVKARHFGQSTMRHADGKTYAFTSPNASAQSHKISDAVIRINRQSGPIGGGLDHPAVFPVDFPAELQRAFSSPGQAVYDPFLGSGTTMIAAEKEARACYGMEIAPQYVDVAVRRWQEFTGEQATLEGDERTFEEISQERLKAAA